MPNIHVLVVDDDPELLALLSLHLSARGFSVVGARDGKKALEQLERYKPEMILADARMPVMDGFELCRRVRAIGHTDIPFVLVSAQGEVPDRIRGFRTGADDFLVKPLNPEELTWKVRRHIERSRKMLHFKELASSKLDQDAISGNLGNLGVPEVLQIADMMGEGDLLLQLESSEGTKGSIQMKGHCVHHAETNGVNGKKAFLRILAWKEGRFQIGKKAFDGQPSLNVSLNALLLDSLAELDKVNALRAELQNSDLSEIASLGQPSISDVAVYIFELACRCDTLDAILNESVLSDLETLETLAKLRDDAFSQAPARRSVS